MSDISVLTDAQVVLLAAHYISEIDVDSLRTLAAQRKDILTNDVIYRLLLTLYPSDPAARAGLSALLRDVESNFSQDSSLDYDIDTSFIAKIPSAVASKQVKDLGILHGSYGQKSGRADSLSGFLISWAHRVEDEEGSLESLTPILEEFCKDNSTLDRWTKQYFVPLYRLQYYFYPGAADDLTLRGLESLRGISGVNTLLSFSQKPLAQADLARDLDQIITPWIGSAQDESSDTEGDSTASWDDVFEWLLSNSKEEFPLLGQALLRWNGPPISRSNPKRSEVQADYAQTLVATIYASQATTRETLSLSRQLLHQVLMIPRIRIPDFESNFPDISHLASALEGSSAADFLSNALRLHRNPVTRVSESSLAFLHGVLCSADILAAYKLFVKLSDVAQICLFGTEERQRQEFLKLLQQIPKLTSFKPDWPSVREQVHWLRSWQSSSTKMIGSEVRLSFLGRLEDDFLETEILGAMLAAGYFAEAKELYVAAHPPPLPLPTVEKQIMSAIYLAYDNSSNGNRTRGGMKRASEILSIFKPAFPRSEPILEIESLLKATHALSFYHLTLDHGVPFRPVNIRASRDPLSLLEKVLEQDQRAYTKIDDLLEIGRNLVLARLGHSIAQIEPSESVQTQIEEANQKITYLAITAALAHHDFDTAYSYITTRLSTSPTDVAQSKSVDDVTWRAVYAAGKYKPAHSPRSLHDRIADLSKRMDLLSLALTLVPNDEHLSEILGQWRRCEEEMDNLKSQALEEERAFDRRGGGETLPGGFGMDDVEQDVADTRRALAKRTLANSTASYEEEAPMGLFDVAKGAASALRRSAFPLNAGQGKDIKIHDTSSRHPGFGSQATSSEDELMGRTRKRDVVSNMVTSGLMSGMGWVLGAQPVDRTVDETK